MLRKLKKAIKQSAVDYHNLNGRTTKRLRVLIFPVRTWNTPLYANCCVVDKSMVKWAIQSNMGKLM